MTFFKSARAELRTQKRFSVKTNCLLKKNTLYKLSARLAGNNFDVKLHFFKLSFMNYDSF